MTLQNCFGVVHTVDYSSYKAILFPYTVYRVIFVSAFLRDFDVKWFSDFFAGFMIRVSVYN